MARAGDVKPPIPSSPYIWRLGVKRIVPATDNYLDPAFNIAGKFVFPRAPAPLALFGEVIERNGVPVEPTI